jgi:hypothetical protein
LYGDELKWFNSYKKMASRIIHSSEGTEVTPFKLTISSKVLQAQWLSTSFESLFEGWNVTVTAN